MSARHVLALALLSAGLGVACGSDFEPPSRLAKLRLLGVRADNPFARPGDEVALEALALDPAGRELTWAWATCVNPAASGATGCLAEADWATAVTGRSLDRHRVRVPADALAKLAPEARPAAVLGVAVVVCPGTLARGTGLPPTPLSCTDATGRTLGLDEVEVAVKRVFLRASDVNTNPAIEGVTWDGAPWPEGEVREADACDTAKDDFSECDEALAHRVEVRSPAGERGLDENGVPFDEQTVVQLYATEGIFEHAVRIASDPATRWVGRTPARGRVVDFWFVVRDDRGGVTWTTRRARVR